MTEEERKALIALLAGQINTGANPLLMSSAYPYNVSAAGVTSAFNPEILFASGAVSPETVAAGQKDVYEQLLAEYAKRSQPRVVYEATEQYLRDSLGRYGTGTDPVSDFVQQAAARIAAGDMTPDQILAEGQKSAKDLPKEVVDNWASVSSALTDFGKKADTYRTAKAKQAFDAQTSMADLGPAPSMTEARMKYFKDLGVPQLAALPDPTEQFNVSSETFIDDRAKYDALQNALRLESEKRSKAGASKTAQEAIRLGKEAEIYARKAALELANKRADAKVADFQDNPAFLDYAQGLNNILAGTAVGAGVGSVVPVIGTPVGAALGGLGGLASAVTGWFDRDKELEQRKNLARQLSYMTELAKLNKDITPASSEASKLKYDPAYKAAVEAQSVAKGRVSQEEAYARLVADAFNKRLAERGVTPYNQAMNSVLGYAIQTGRK
jgi:hypothetical protein